ncbi:hypothetical protein EJB05_39870, partial [Eragrostis curvula]
MDWHAWLSAARLDPAVVYEYALVFARNELEADDVAYLDHELLHSMGVSVAKHRLEILKLAWRDHDRRPSPLSPGPRQRPPLSRLVHRVARYVRALVRREEDSTTALVLVPSHQQQHDDGRKRRGKALRRAKSEPKGSTSTPRAARQAIIGGRGAAAVHALSRDLDASDGEETVRWDSLFRDLRPN